jgi:hypothetical protein
VIPSGHEPIDRAGIAALHGLAWSTARNTAKPWSQPGHPKPISGSGHQGQPFLWDKAQATAYAKGEPIPPLPTKPQPGDRLDRFEAAKVAKVEPSYWAADKYRGRVPEPDEVHYDVPFWLRKTAEAEKRRRAAGRTPGGGRPAGSTETTKRAEIPQKVAKLIAQAREAGAEVNIAEIARELGIAYTTAHKHVHRIQDDQAATPTDARPRPRARK